MMQKKEPFLAAAPKESDILRALERVAMEGDVHIEEGLG